VRFLTLTEIGARHSNEEGTAGMRVATLEFAATRLRAYEVHRDMLRHKIEGLSPTHPKPVPARPLTAAPSAPPPTTMKNAGAGAALGGHRPGWAAAKPAAGPRASNTPTTSSAQRLARLKVQLAEIEAQIVKEQTKLKMEGAHIQPNGEIFWRASERVVEYDHDLAKQQLSRITFTSGRLYLGTKPFDTREMYTGNAGVGHAIFVVSAEGNVHVGSHVVGNRHHSSLLAGTKVAGAGELKCTDGRLLFVSNKSGHYRPTVSHMVQVLHLLSKHGVPPTFTVSLLPTGGRFKDPDEFLQSIAHEDQYHVAKLRRYASYLTDEILGQHAPDPWRTFDPDRELLGVYCAMTHRRINPKVVRQWLKARGMTAVARVLSGAGR
jgi:hypothetical protein